MKTERLKIIHVGNIANNAYNNSKMLNKAGYDCDVFCPDYYHIMGCPEWEDAEFNTDRIGDSFFPNWKKARVRNFKRPKWFISGPLIWARRYIIAKREEKKFLSRIYWQCLSWARNDIVKSKEYNKYALADYEEKRNKRIEEYIKKYSNSKNKFVDKWIKKLIKKQNARQDDMSGIKTIEEIEEDFKKLFPERKCEFGDLAISFRYAAAYYKPILDKYDIAVMYATNPILTYLAGYENYIAYEHGTIRDLPYEESDMGRLTALAYANAKAIYVTNLDCYDSAKYIVRYINTPIICGLHGLDMNRIVSKMNSQIKKSYFDPRFGVSREETLFFCPARHDYDNVKGAFMKAEDKVLFAAAKLAESFADFKILFVDWGNDVERIKEIVKSQGLEKHVFWVKPIKKEELYQVYQNSDAVLDQFFWRVYGGITFEVLAAQKCALISSGVREDYQREFFGSTLPYFACDDVNDIYNAMRETVLKTEKYIMYTSTSRNWVMQHHSNERIIQKLETAFSYCDILGEN